MHSMHEELTARYAEISDRELLALAAEPDSLTDAAQIVLRSEMRKRRLDDSDVQAYLRRRNDPTDDEIVSASDDKLLRMRGTTIFSEEAQGEIAAEIRGRGLAGDAMQKSEESPSEDFAVFASRFAQSSNEELLQIAAEPETLIADIRHALQNELSRRGLPVPEALVRPPEIPDQWEDEPQLAVEEDWEGELADNVDDAGIEERH
jgi:hypothetical protein